MSNADFYETRTSSAGYRFPIQRRPQTTVGPRGAAGASPAAVASPTTRRPATGTSAAVDTADPVRQDRIWTETLDNHRRRNKVWLAEPRS